MKKLLSFLITIVMLFATLPLSYALTDLSTFDYQGVLGSREGYDFDKFNKSWSYYRAYVEEFSDGRLVIGLQTESDPGESGPSLTALYVKLMDRSGNKLYDIESVDFLIGEDMYSFESMLTDDTSSTVVLADNGLLLLKAFSECDASEVAVRLGVKNRGSMKLDLDSSKLTNTLKEFSRVYLKYNIWDYCTDKETANHYESFFPMKINGELVEKEAA